MGMHDNVDNFGVEKMGKEEHDKMQAHVEANCKCKSCPTYVEGDAPIGYCFPLIGTSKKIQWEKDCVCSTCPVYKEYELTHTFYCTRCSQFCQNIKVDYLAGQGGSG